MKTAPSLRSPYLVTAAIRDVSVRKATERHLTQMEGRYRGLLEAAPDAMVVVNQGGNIILLNIQAEKQFGYRRDELLGQPVKNIIPQGFAERLVADDLRSAKEALAQQIGTGIELIGRRKDGSEFPIELMLSPLESDEGILVTAAIRNISVRKAAETHLTQMESRYRGLLEAAPDAMVVVNQGGDIVLLNLQAEKQFGYRRDELLGQPVKNIIPQGFAERLVADDLRSEEDALAQQIDTGIELIGRRKDGSEFPIELMLSPLENADGILVTAAIRNISVRKAAETHLAQMEGRYRGLLEAAPDAMVMVNQGGDIVLLNIQAEKQFGYRRDELLGQPVKDIIPQGFAERLVADDLRSEEDALAQQIGTGIELIGRRKDGSEFPIELMLSPLESDEGILVTAAIRNISVRKQIENELRASERLLRWAQNLAQMGTDIRDLRTGEREWSDETYRIFGVSPESFDATYANVLALIHPDDRYRVTEGRERTVEGICPEPTEYRVVPPDGNVRHIYREWELVRDDAGEPVQLLGIAQDVTQRRHTEDQLRQAQKMEAIGNLTGGMAHDFNNMLGIIIGSLDLAGPLVTENEEASELVQEAIDAAIRGAELTRALLAFARQQPLRPKRIAPNELVSGIVQLFRRTLGENIEITLDLEEKVWPVVVDAGQLEACLTNLATNARDAMPNGGKLLFAVSNVHLDADYASIHIEVTPGDYVAIEVTDTGTGMIQEVADQIFEPFFTTKEIGKGTGLGLSMVFGFVKQTGGHISVYSEPGIGTTFQLYLPRVAEERAAVAETQAAAAPRGAGETVLAVEDNPRLRHVVMRQLSELGYKPIEADGPAAALAILEREKIDLLFTDVVMPGPLDGIALAKLAFERWPKIKVVLTSGFPGTKLDDQLGPSSAAVRLVSKPYRTETLAGVLREALDG